MFGQNMHHCPRCDQKVRALRSSSVAVAPRVLILHILRFEMRTNAKGQQYRHKITAPVRTRAV